MPPAWRARWAGTRFDSGAGTGGELQLVDERLAGRAPASIGFLAAAQPFTLITAWIHSPGARNVIDEFRPLPEPLRAIGRAQLDHADLTNRDCGALLTRIGQLVDSGVLRSPLVEPCGTINATNLRRAHAFLKRGEARGKVVLSGF